MLDIITNIIVIIITENRKGEIAQRNSVIYITVGSVVGGLVTVAVILVIYLKRRGCFGGSKNSTESFANPTYDTAMDNVKVPLPKRMDMDENDYVLMS